VVDDDGTSKWFCLSHFGKYIHAQLHAADWRRLKLVAKRAY
jgi:hypothetical protein